MTSEAEIVLDDVLAAIDLIRPFLPMGSPVAMGITLVYEAIVEIRSLETSLNPEELKKRLADKLGADVVGELKDRFG
jgi:hypothetical protein